MPHARRFLARLSTPAVVQVISVTSIPRFRWGEGLTNTMLRSTHHV